MNGPLLRMLGIILFISEKASIVVLFILKPLKFLAKIAILDKVLQYINDHDLD